MTSIGCQKLPKYRMPGYDKCPMSSDVGLPADKRRRYRRIVVWGVQLEWSVVTTVMYRTDRLVCQWRLLLLGHMMSFLVSADLRRSYMRRAVRGLWWGRPCSSTGGAAGLSAPRLVQLGAVAVRVVTQGSTLNRAGEKESVRRWWSESDESFMFRAEMNSLIMFNLWS